MRDAVKNDRTGLLLSCIASLLFHLAVYALVAYTAVSYPVIAASSQDKVIWFYPALMFFSMSPPSSSDPPLPGEQPARMSEEKVDLSSDAVEPDTLQPADKPQAVVPVEPPGLAAPAGEVEMVSVVSSRQPARKPPPEVNAVPSAPAAKPDRKPPREPIAMKTGAGGEKNIPAQTEPIQADPPSEKPAEMIARIAPAASAVALREVDVPNNREKEAAKIAETARIVVASTKDNESGKAVIVAPDAPKAPEKEVARLPVIRKAVEKKQVLPLAPVAKKENKKMPEEPPVPVKTEPVKPIVPVVPPRQEVKQPPAPVKTEQIRPAAPVVPRQEEKPKQVAMPAKPAAASLQEKSPVRTEIAVKPAETDRPATQGKARDTVDTHNDASSTAKGIFAPPLTGDLKFEFISPQMVQRGGKVVVLFRDFPKAKRGRPVSKAEARRLSPLDSKMMVVAGKNTLQAVVYKVGEGVCYLHVEFVQQAAAETSIIVKLYEGSPRARTINLPLRTIRHNETILRILMPEGILWDDPDAFSGSLESSDSVTRFNTETGLVWKEYN